jgi:hypothetical protein
MREAEQEATRLCPGTTVFLDYSRRHYTYDFRSDKGFRIECSIYVEGLGLFTGSDWATAVHSLRETLRVNPPQPCPDEETAAA